jgi:tryptophan synthase alpha chain
VSSASTTGKQKGLQESDYLKNLKNLGLDHPMFVGFNISTADDLALVHRHAAGGIIGSAFIRHLAGSNGPLDERCKAFVRTVRGLEEV